jgi:hypothetical protein
VSRLAELDLAMIYRVTRSRLALVRDVPTITVDTGLGVVLARSLFTVMLPTLKVLLFTVATDLGTNLAQSVLTMIVAARLRGVPTQALPTGLGFLLMGWIFSTFIARSLRTALTTGPISYALITITSHLYQEQKACCRFKERRS